ncbi:tetratricopeptide repeat protein, partial [Nocardia sp. NEAU-G5]
TNTSGLRATGTTSTGSIAGHRPMINPPPRLRVSASTFQDTALALEVLNPEPATDLFLTIAQRNPHTRGEREAAARTADVCGRLPLAIGLVAGQAAHHPRWTAADIATRADALATAANRLAILDPVDDPVVRVAFDLSYRDLPPKRKLLFRRLGLHPGPHFDTFAVAALAGIPVAVAQNELNALYVDHLLDETASDRFRLHDLLRNYAHTLTTGDPAFDNDQAVDRLLDYYQTAASAADRWLVRRPRPTVRPPTPHRSIPTQDFSGEMQAVAWMRLERANLVACLESVATNSSERLLALTGLLAGLLERDGPWSQALELHRRAADNAEHLGDRLCLANAFTDLGVVRRDTGDYGAATGLDQQALAIYREIGNRLGEANALTNLGVVRRDTGDYGTATDLDQRALAIYREIGNRLGEANALRNLGVVRWATGDYGTATDLNWQALAIYREIGNRLGEADALRNLGVVRWATGDYGEAADLHQQALEIFRGVGNRFGEANALRNLGVVRWATEDYGEAADLHQQALVIFQGIGNRRGEAEVVNEIGTVLLATSELNEALRMFTDALNLAETIGSQRERARALEGTARAQAALGDTDAAIAQLRAAVDIYRHLKAPEAEIAAMYLSELETRPLSN